MTEAVRLGLKLFGAPRRESGHEPETVRPEQLQLVAWELLTAKVLKSAHDGPAMDPIAQPELQIK